MAPASRTSRSPIRAWLPALHAAALAAALLATGGCQPGGMSLLDKDALRAAKRVVVLPLADAPGPDGRGSGQAAAGAVTAELLRIGYHEVVDVGSAALEEQLRKSGYAPCDVYDPVVCGELARALGADAAISGAMLHYGAQREHSESKVLIVNTGQTRSTHWVAMNVRLVTAKDAKIIYVGSGSASSMEGYAPAAKSACESAFADLKWFVDHAK